MSFRRFTIISLNFWKSVIIYVFLDFLMHKTYRNEFKKCNTDLTSLPCSLMNLSLHTFQLLFLSWNNKMIWHWTKLELRNVFTFKKYSTYSVNKFTYFELSRLTDYFQVNQTPSM